MVEKLVQRHTKKHVRLICHGASCAGSAGRDDLGAFWGDLTEELSAPEPIETVEERPVGSVVEQYDDRIASLDSAWHTEEHALRGFRVQIFSGSLQAAREVRANARKTSGEWPVYLSSMPPNYRVTIGDFRSRWEAQKAQDAWDKAFPMSIVIPMDINLPRLQTGRADKP